MFSFHSAIKVCALEMLFEQETYRFCLVIGHGMILGFEVVLYSLVGFGGFGMVLVLIC